MSETQAEPAALGQAASSAPVFRLVYRSRSCMARAEADAELGRIFSVARRNNKETGVTGALLMHADWFAQALEGPETEVRTLFERIRRDPRHEAVEVRSEKTVTDRAFPRWAMAEVQGYGERDAPILASADGLAEGAPWKVSPAQEAVLAELRMLAGGYGDAPKL